MWVRSKQTCLILLVVILLLSLMYGSLRMVAAQDVSPWLTAETPLLSKVLDLPNGSLPSDYPIGCADITYVPLGSTTPRLTCAFQSPLGTLTQDGMIQTGPDTFATLYGTGRSIFIPSLDPSIALASVEAPTIGNYIAVYHHLSKSTMQLTPSYGQGSHYEVSAKPDAVLRNPVTGGPLQINTMDVVFSANGEWMLINMPKVGLARVNMTDLSVKLFTSAIEPVWFLGMDSPPMAISDDGRYVAANADPRGVGNLKMYDLSTCDDQLNVPANQNSYCAGKNIWEGRKLDGERVGQGLLDEQPGMEHPTHLRFINDDSLSFSADYDATSGGVHKAATFVATAPGGVEHKLGLLGMGDSYISGQGAFDYREGTDTDNNGCHLSDLSYPSILGKEDFDSYNSVACSGAVTRNVSQNVDTKATINTYIGQVKDKIEEQNRDKQNILANFLPGYIYQQEFASTYLPEAILLSVGGDDVGFANIVKSCVANSGGGTCYDTYEDRAELLNEINGVYSKLVNTYKTLREQSGGARLYAVGYPQIAKPGGDCGLNVHLNGDEVTFSARLIDYLDSVVQRAAQTAGVVYVDTQHAFDGHRLCEAPAGESAMNGFTVGNDAGITIDGHVINFIGAESYHPTALGYRLLADTIAKATKNLAASMPGPTAYAAPVLDPSLPILQDVPRTGRAMKRVANDPAIADDFVVRGAAQQVAVNGAELQLQPGSPYQVVLHSDPIVLDEGGVDEDGNVATTVHIPTDVAPGYHVLHVYGKDMAGDDVDIQKILYVAASVDDYDGDGTANEANACMLLPLSHQDVDQDGIDDACDPAITPASSPVEVSGKAVIDQGVAAAMQASISDALQNGSPASRSVSTVLGDAVASTSHVVPKSAAIAGRPIAQKLYRVDWLTVLAVGFGSTIGATTLYCCFRRN